MNECNSRQRVFLTDVHCRGNSVLSTARDLLRTYGLFTFQIASTPEEADIILYLEHGYLGLSDIPRVLKCVRAAPRAMHFVFSESDWPFPVLPGAYPSLSRPCSWAHTWSYLSGSKRKTSNGSSSDCTVAPEFLFSFLGRVNTHPVRKKIQMLDTPNTPCLDVNDGPKRFARFSYDDTYTDLISRSKFILCPRGFGVSSIRIFEAMSFGRVPVIISDHWQPPPGIRWQEFCVWVQEDDVTRIPDVLNRLRGDSSSMGHRAGQVYNEYFAREVFLDRLLSTLVSKYSNCGFTTDAILQRAWRALGWREIWTVCHQARTLASSALVKNVSS